MTTTPNRKLAMDLGGVFAAQVLSRLPAAQELMAKEFDDVHLDARVRFTRNKKGEVSARITISAPRGRWPRPKTFSLVLDRDQMDLFAGG